MKALLWTVAVMTMGVPLPAQDAKDAAPKGPSIPVDVQFLVTHHQGEKKIGSKPYSIRLYTEEKGGFFIGTHVPYRTTAQSGPTVAFKGIGASAKCLVHDAGGGRFRLVVDFDEAAGFRARPETIPAEDRVDGPVPHTLNAKSTLHLRDRETAQLATVVDPLTGDTARVDVTLTRVAEGPATAPAAAASAPPKVQVVVTRRQGDKTISREPYSVTIDNEEKGTVYAGAEIPYRVGSSTGATLVFKQTGTKAAFSVRAVENGRYRVGVDIEHSSVFAVPGGAGAADRSAPMDRVDGPMLRTFTTQSTAYLRHGETMPLSSAVDPVTGEVAKVEVTLHVGP
jgi:hypothetical protein